MTLRKFILAAGVGAALMALPSCLGETDWEKTAEWRNANNEYVEEQRAKTENGEKVFEMVSPTWQPTAYVLMQWHNDRSLTANNLQPLYNSTVDVTYELRNINDEVVENSFSLTANGDSIFRCQPKSTVPGFAIALTNMHVGDSCTVIIPWQFAYGSQATSSLKAYSTLVYGLKLVGVPAYQKED